MPVKDFIVRKLREGTYISGQQLGRESGVSRTAVWKYINELRRDGYGIISAPKRGYLLVNTPDTPWPEEVRAGLDTRAMGRILTFHREVSSTQDVARRLADNGAEEGTAVIAETQASGHGRLGRPWASPPGGLYLSVILRPSISPPEALKLPLICGVAVVHAIQDLVPLSVRVKWPNDVLINGKKVCGILTEMNAETDRLNYVIIGIGINVNTPADAFPPDIRHIATSLLIECATTVSRVRLVQRIFGRLELLYDTFRQSGFESIRQEWKRHSTVIGSVCDASSPGHRITGIAVDLDRDGALILQTSDGRHERIIAGDITLMDSTRT